MTHFYLQVFLRGDHGRVLHVPEGDVHEHVACLEDRVVLVLRHRAEHALGPAKSGGVPQLRSFQT